MQGGDAPYEDPDLELGPGLGEIVQQRAQRRTILDIGPQPDPPIEIPADDHDRASRQPEGIVETGEEAGRIDQNRRPTGLGDAPAVPALLEDRRRGR
jgi:hypothetical protein